MSPAVILLVSWNPKDYRENFELYHILEDAKESIDLAEQKPEVLVKMVAYWKKWKILVENSAKGYGCGLSNYF